MKMTHRRLSLFVAAVLVANVCAARPGRLYNSVFMHHPPFIVSVDEDDSWNNWPGRYRELFLALFKKYRVDALFAGHLHQSAATSWSGIPVYVCTASGKTLGKGISGINLISVSPSGVSCREIPLP